MTMASASIRQRRSQAAARSKISRTTWDAAWSFFEKLKANEPLLGEDPDFTAWFQNGEIDVACTIISNARAAKQNGVPVSWTVPKEGAKLDTDGLWIPKGLPENELYWAKNYIETALSAESLQTWCNGLGLPPVRPGLEPPEDLVGDPAYPTTEEDLAPTDPRAYSRTGRARERLVREGQRNHAGLGRKVRQP